MKYGQVITRGPVLKDGKTVVDDVDVLDLSDVAFRAFIIDRLLSIGVVNGKSSKGLRTPVIEYCQRGVSMPDFRVEAPPQASRPLAVPSQLKSDPGDSAGADSGAK